MEFNHENAAMIPYYVHEGEMVRMERVNKRCFIAFMIVLVMLFVTNIGWIVYESQFTDVVTTTEIEADQDGDYNFVSGGDLNYVTASPNQNNNESAGESE